MNKCIVKIIIFHGVSLSGVLGKKQHCLQSSIPSINITILSNPNPAPACGGHPYLNEFM